MDNIYQLIFEDSVEKPYVSLRHALRCDLYKVSLLKMRYPDDTPKSYSRVKQWLRQRKTFDEFKKTVENLIAIHELSINLNALRYENWLIHVASDDNIIHEIRVWLRGGCAEMKYDWFEENEPNIFCKWVSSALDIETFWKNRRN